MSDIFTLNSGDATAIQQHYEQIIETLLRTLLDVKNSGDNQQQDLKIFDSDRLVYGRDNNQFRDEISGISGQLLNPQLISELQQLRSTPVGDVASGVSNKKVELDGQVILQSNENGKVIVNNLLGEQTVNISQEKPEIAKENNYSEERQDLNQIHEGDFLNTESNNHSSSVKEDTNLPLTNGSTRVKESLQVLEDSPLKNILLAEVEQLRTELKALQQERHFYQELIEKRLQQPKNTSWWQQAVNNVSTVVQGVTSAIKLGMQEFKANSVQHKGATSLKTLFHLQTQPGANQYTAGNYQISRQGSKYEVSNSSTGKLLMQFRSTPLGLKVEQGNLDSTQIQDVSFLQHSLKKNEPLPTTFTPVGKQEKDSDVLSQKEWRIILNNTVNCTGAELARMVEKAARKLFHQGLKMNIGLNELLEQRDSMVPLYVRDTDRILAIANRAKYFAQPASSEDTSVFAPAITSFWGDAV